MTDLVYIMSHSYSGSTLLTFLLASHPSIGTIGELKGQALGDIDAYLCSCGHKIRECEFWRNLSQELGNNGVSFDLADFGTHFESKTHALTNRLLLTRYRGPVFEIARNVAMRFLPGCRGKIRQILAKNKAMIEAVLKLQKADIFLDGSKDVVRLKYLVEARHWNIKVIYLIRDGRGTANSYMKHHKTTMVKAALEWEGTYREGKQILARIAPDSWVQIRYEDLCRRPEEVVDTIFRFIGCDPGLASREFRATGQHIIGNSMRLRATSEIRLDEKWRRELSERDLATFGRIAGALNRKYGYA